jgi:hypothetical protein
MHPGPGGLQTVLLTRCTIWVPRPPQRRGNSHYRAIRVSQTVPSKCRYTLGTKVPLPAGYTCLISGGWRDIRKAGGALDLKTIKNKNEGDQRCRNHV